MTLLDGKISVAFEVLKNVERYQCQKNKICDKIHLIFFNKYVIILTNANATYSSRPCAFMRGRVAIPFFILE